MKTLADFRRKIQVGTKLHTYHYRLGDMGIRPVSIVQSTQFALETLKEFGTDQYKFDSWVQFPKAKDFEVQDGAAVIFWGEGDRREPILKYTFVTEIPA